MRFYFHLSATCFSRRQRHDGNVILFRGCEGAVEGDEAAAGQRRAEVQRSRRPEAHLRESGVRAPHRSLARYAGCSGIHRVWLKALISVT